MRKIIIRQLEQRGFKVVVDVYDRHQVFLISKGGKEHITTKLESFFETLDFLEQCGGIK